MTDCKKLQAENDALRRALRKIMDRARYQLSTQELNGHRIETAVTWMMDTAEEALGYLWHEIQIPQNDKEA